MRDVMTSWSRRMRTSVTVTSITRRHVARCCYLTHDTRITRQCKLINGTQSHTRARATSSVSASVATRVSNTSMTRVALEPGERGFNPAVSARAHCDTELRETLSRQSPVRLCTYVQTENKTLYCASRKENRAKWRQKSREQ